MCVCSSGTARTLSGKGRGVQGYKKKTFQKTFSSSHGCHLYLESNSYMWEGDYAGVSLHLCSNDYAIIENIFLNYRANSDYSINRKQVQH